MFLPFFALEVSGREGLPDRSAFVLFPKHQRWEDIPLLGLAATRPLYYIAKYELFKNPFSRWYLTSLGGMPLNRRRPLESRASLRGMFHLLSAGEGVVVFPEGTYYRGRMGQGRIGLVRLILSRVSLPFIPVGITYAPRKGRIPVRIRFGEPLYAGPDTAPKEFLQRMMRQIALLSGIQQ